MATRRRIWLLALVVLGGVGAVWWALRPVMVPPSPTPRVQGRGEHTATLLRDGTILVVGGRPFPGYETAITERYDPRTGLWHDAGRLREARTNHTATLLPDGSVLVVGGVGRRSWTGHKRGITMVERYLPEKNRWVTVAPLPQGVTAHSAVLLPDGGVLVVGGATSDDIYSQPVKSAWRFDLTDNSWRELSSMQEPREGCVAVVLPDGRVLVVGGYGGGTGRGPSPRSAEIYTAASDRWQFTTIPALSGIVGQPTTLLQDGQVLVLSGDETIIFDPRTDQWAQAMRNDPQASDGSLTMLRSGEALYVGGRIVGRYDATTDRWRFEQSKFSRTGHTATLLADGRVVLIGGQSIERYGAGHDVEIIQP